MNEKAYHAKLDKLFLELEEALEAASPDLDWDLQEGILTITFPQGSQLILSRQSSSEELWLASPTGAFHFQDTEQGWVTRKGESLTTTLQHIFNHYHIQVTL